MVVISYVPPETELLQSEVEVVSPEADILPSQAEVCQLQLESLLQKSFLVNEKCKYSRRLSLCQTYSTTGLPHNYYDRFKKMIRKLDDLKQEPSFVSFTHLERLADSSWASESFMSHSGGFFLVCFEIRQWEIQVNTRLDVPLASFIQVQIHGLKEVDCCLLHQMMQFSQLGATHKVQKDFQDGR